MSKVNAKQQQGLGQARARALRAGAIGLLSCGRLQNSNAMVMLCVSCLVSLEYPAL